MSNWRSRLTYVAWAAQAAALCALVTRNQQCSLAKVASGSAVAERTYVSRIECSRSFRGSFAAARVPAPADMWQPRTPLGGESVPSPLRGLDSIWGSGTRWEVRGPWLFWLSAPFSGTRGVNGPFPSKEWVWGR